MPPRWPLPLLVAAALPSLAVHAQRTPAASDLLQAADGYLVAFAQRLSIVTATEVYAQYDTSAEKARTPRRLSGDILLFGFADGSVASFRDVAAIDSAPLRASDGRLAALFLDLKADPSSALEQARQLTGDSVVHYLSSNLHALDQPTIALEFLRKANQQRSAFKVESVKNSGEGAIAVVKFTERSTSRLVPMPGGGGAVGRFWIDAASGTVRQTEIGIASQGVSVRATVKYGLEPSLNLWLPVEMSQQIDISGAGSSNFSNMGGGPGYRVRESFEGRATYSGFRRVAAGNR